MTTKIVDAFGDVWDVMDVLGVNNGETIRNNMILDGKTASIEGIEMMNEKMNEKKPLIRRPHVNVAQTELASGLKLYNLLQIASILGVSYRTLLNYVQAKKLVCRKIGGRWYCTDENLKQFLSGE